MDAIEFNHCRQFAGSVPRFNSTTGARSSEWESPLLYVSKNTVLAMASVPDLVKISKLETRFLSDPDCTQHRIEYIPKGAKERKKVCKEEKWKRKKRLGRGASGIGWLEQCIQGDSKNQLRAVKELSKQGSENYTRELEAIALFSHTQVIIILIMKVF